MEPKKQLPKSQGIRLLQRLFLSGKRIFNIQDATDAALQENIPLNQLNKILSSLARHERITRLRRGLYTSIGMVPVQDEIHPFVIATHLVQPSAISHWSALQHHGLTEQVPQIVTASTPTKVVTPSMRDKELRKLKLKHMWQVGNVRYDYIYVQQKRFFGLENIWLDEYSQVPITDKERTLLDVFAYPKMFGGIGAALGILEGALPTINIDKLVKYALQYKKNYLIKRLGWSLEYFGVNKKHLAPLLNSPMNYYCRLDPSKPASGEYDNRWMIQNNLIQVKK
jgi:predicted transcriptional regulator of viral defense system